MNNIQNIQAYTQMVPKMGKSRKCHIISKKGFSNEASLNSTKVYIIDLALNLFIESTYQNFMIFADSLSVLKSLKIKKPWEPTNHNPHKQMK